jgi:hypothetical protein
MEWIENTDVAKVTKEFGQDSQNSGQDSNRCLPNRSHAVLMCESVSQYRFCTVQCEVAKTVRKLAQRDGRKPRNPSGKMDNFTVCFPLQKFRQRANTQVDIPQILRCSRSSGSLEF